MPISRTCVDRADDTKARDGGWNTYSVPLKYRTPRTSDSPGPKSVPTERGAAEYQYSVETGLVSAANMPTPSLPLIHETR